MTIKKYNAAKAHAYYASHPGVWKAYYSRRRKAGSLSKTSGSKAKNEVTGRKLSTSKANAKKITSAAPEKRSITSYGSKKAAKTVASVKSKKFKGDIKALDKAADRNIAALTKSKAEHQQRTANTIIAKHKIQQRQATKAAANNPLNIAKDKAAGYKSRGGLDDAAINKSIARNKAAATKKPQ